MPIGIRCGFLLGDTLGVRGAELSQLVHPAGVEELVPEDAAVCSGEADRSDVEIAGAGRAEAEGADAGQAGAGRAGAEAADAGQVGAGEAGVGRAGGIGGRVGALGGIGGGVNVPLYEPHGLLKQLHRQSVFIQGGAGICGLQKQPHRKLLF